MAVVNLATFEDVLGGTAPVNAVLTATVYRGLVRAVRVDGDEVLFPEDIKIKIVNGVPAEPFVLLQLPADCYWKIDVTSKNDAPLRINAILPLGDGPFDIDQLILVDPKTSLPDPTKSLAEALVEQVTDAANRAEAALGASEAIVDGMIVGGHIETDNLILETYGGDTVDAGSVRGPQGYGVEPGGTAGQVLVKASSADYDTQWQSASASANQTVVINMSGMTINKGDVVYIVGAQAGELGVDLAQADSDDTSSQILGLASSVIQANEVGYVLNNDFLDMVDTSGSTVGDPVWLSDTVPGGFTHIKPVAPSKHIVVGYVRNVSATEGSIYAQVGADSGTDLANLSDVEIIDLADGDIIVYDQATSSWQNKAPNFQGYTHTQGADSTLWVINHNLNYYPNVNIQDTAGTTIEGVISYNSSNELQVEFSVAVSGVAHLS